MFEQNSLKQRLGRGERLFGAWIESGSATIVEMLGLTGFDFLLVDLEHGQGDLSHLIDMLRAAAAVRCPCMVRVPWNDPVFLKRVLDAGAQSIMIPSIDSAEAAAAAVRACRYPPRGQRGYAAPVVRASGYGAVPDYRARAHDELLLVLQVESAAAVDAAAAIAATDGVDLVFIGVNDLAGSIGRLEELDHPDVRALVRRAEAALHASGKWMGSLPSAGATADDLCREGYHLITIAGDLPLLRSGALAVVGEHRRRFGSAQAQSAIPAAPAYGAGAPRGDVIDDLRAALGTAVLDRADLPPRHASDWSGLPPVTPRAVVRPATPEDVATAMAICARHRVPVVPQGGLTGLAGGARPTPDAVALSLERLVGIEEIDPASATLTVRAGTTLETVQAAADEAGFLFPLDLGSRGSCTIGGNLATNAGGNRVLRYGMMRDLVLGLEVVLADGERLSSLNKMTKNNAGYDLKQVFIGSEGTLGIITRAVLRLFPRPATTSVALCAVANYGRVQSLLAAARERLGPCLSAFEVMWSDYWQIATTRIAGVPRPLVTEAAFVVLAESQGQDAADGERFGAWLEAAAEAGLIEDAVVSRSTADVKAFWATRDATAGFESVLGHGVSFDIGLPLALMDDFARACRSALQAALPEALCVFFGHIADGNLHVGVYHPNGVAAHETAIEALVYGLVRARGGTISAEHGIGTLKKPYLSYSRSEGELKLMRRLKQALDPDGLLNPGKILD